MRGDAVEKPTVVADNHGTPRKVVKTFFQCAESVDVDVVGGFVEENDVAFFFERHGEVKTVAFAARKHSDFLFLVGAGEVESREIGAGVHIAAAHAEGLYSLRNHFIDGAVGQEVMVVLVNVCDFDGFAHFECSRVRLFLAHNQAEQCGFAGSVRTYNTYDSVWRQGET